MRIVIKGALCDTLAFILGLKKRNRIFKRTGIKKLNPGPMNVLAASLHPRRQLMKIHSVRADTPSSRTYRLVLAREPGSPAVFRAGQYVSVEESVDGIPVSRPFSLSSTPREASEEHFYEITLGEKEDGFFAPWCFKEWEPGRVLCLSEPTGTFTLEPLRDASHMVCLAGGCGVTPFRSIILDALEQQGDTKFTLFYGVTRPEEIIFQDEWAALEVSHPDRFKMIVVCSGDDPGWKGEKGFLTPSLIRKYIPANQDLSFFICGPPAMHDFLTRELKDFHLPIRRLRKENFGRTAVPGRGKKRYVLTVLTREGELRVPAPGTETVLTALERAGLNPPALCRSGECGWCRSRLISGDVEVPRENDGRRAADIKFGWFHPCSSYPRSDLVLKIPENPVQVNINGNTRNKTGGVYDTGS